MQRRAVLGSGVAGLTVAAMTPLWAADRNDTAMAFHSIAMARRQRDLPGLTILPGLNRVVAAQTQHMAFAGMMTHLDAQGRDPAARAQHVGYSGRVLGEALAETFDGPVETVEVWLAHTQTREVLLDTFAQYMGLSMQRDDDGRMWWAMNVGV
ncbi:CAP domain-containing protein [Jannaschia sp. CCS1]|uniref:CAP domain-containing protein n=1 Tax=Jannaschia sp. (strain CCS1) TaxID=290400 RepID=UPI000053C782|nr:CAP domain-containing protein [Jannaschia sp. CCS1]ABD57148.1 hypothetical protein Jann_4232 [Jannaschia sp. CCS1]